jgi:hypothetical protein
MEKSTLESRLTEWARWKLQSGSHNGYPKSSSFTHLSVDNGRRYNHTYEEIDLYCIETDNAVNSLDNDYIEIIRVEYLLNTGREAQEMKLKCELCRLQSRKGYYERLNRAYSALLNIFDRQLATA